MAPLQQPAPARVRAVTRIVGIVVLVCAVVGYVVSLRSGRWPPSHPWSGLSLVIAAAINLGMFDPPAVASTASRLVGAALALIAAVLWLGATFAGLSS